MKKGRFSQGSPHSWLGLGRNGYHHGVARGQVSRTGSVSKRKNSNRYVPFLEHRYATTHSPGNLVRLSRAVAGFKNHPPSSRSTHTLMSRRNKRPNGRTEKTITNEALKIAPSSSPARPAFLSPAADSAGSNLSQMDLICLQNVTP